MYPQPLPASKGGRADSTRTIKTKISLTILSKFLSQSIFRSPIAGALLVLSFAPFHMWYLSFVSLFLFLWVLRYGHPSSNRITHYALHSFLFGLGVIFAGTWWIFGIYHFTYDFSIVKAVVVSVISLTSITILYFVPLGLLLWIAAKLPLKAITFASAWALAELIRTMPFLGFPWYFVGTAFVETPLAGFAPLLGVFGVSWFVALIAYCLYSIFLESIKISQTREAFTNTPSKKILLVNSICIMAVFMTGYALQKIEWTKKLDSNALSVMLMQTHNTKEGQLENENGDKIDNQKRKSETDINADKLIKRYLTEQDSRKTKPDLVLWPENALSKSYLEDGEPVMLLGDRIRELDVTVMSGAATYQVNEDRDRSYRTSIIQFAEDVDYYHKRKLVPIYEHTSFPKWLVELLPILDSGLATVPATRPQKPFKVRENDIGGTICFEIVFPDFWASQAKHTGLVVNVSNDDGISYKNLGAYHIFQAGQMRAVETRRSVVRAANAGISAIIDPYGNVKNQLVMKEGSLYGTVSMRSGDTPFMIFGSKPIITMSIMIILFSLFWRARSQRRVKQSST
ncbi:MAG: apolipoprotein N-acyltransferase [Granulosicoccus sp.]